MIVLLCVPEVLVSVLAVERCYKVIMILDFILDLLKSYLPLIMGFIYLYSYEKNKI